MKRPLFHTKNMRPILTILYLCMFCLPSAYVRSTFQLCSFYVVHRCPHSVYVRSSLSLCSVYSLFSVQSMFSWFCVVIYQVKTPTTHLHVVFGRDISKKGSVGVSIPGQLPKYTLSGLKYPCPAFHGQSHNFEYYKKWEKFLKVLF